MRTPAITTILATILATTGCAPTGDSSALRPLQLLPDIYDCHGDMSLTVTGSAQVAAYAGAANNLNATFQIHCPPREQNGFSLVHNPPPAPVAPVKTIEPAP
jgi:hypothetical protein